MSEGDWEFVARMLDNGLLGQFRGKPQFSARRGRAKWRGRTRRGGEKGGREGTRLYTLAGCYIHRSFSAAVYFIGGRVEEVEQPRSLCRDAGKTGEFLLYITPRKRLHIVARFPV